jgi:hypothetical protein
MAVAGIWTLCIGRIDALSPAERQGLESGGGSV